MTTKADQFLGCTDGHGVAEKMITGADNGSTQLSGDRCDPEPGFLKWLFSKSLNLDHTGDLRIAEGSHPHAAHMQEQRLQRRVLAGAEM